MWRQTWNFVFQCRFVDRQCTRSDFYALCSTFSTRDCNQQPLNCQLITMFLSSTYHFPSKKLAAILFVYSVWLFWFSHTIYAIFMLIRSACQFHALNKIHCRKQLILLKNNITLITHLLWGRIGRYIFWYYIRTVMLVGCSILLRLWKRLLSLQ